MPATTAQDDILRANAPSISVGWPRHMSFSSEEIHEEEAWQAFAAAWSGRAGD